MNEEESIEYLKKKIEDCNHIIEASSYIGNKKAYAKERTKYKEILNLIENQQSELDKKDVTIIETKEANRQLSIELQKKDKIINLMEDEINKILKDGFERIGLDVYLEKENITVREFIERKVENGN